MGDVIPTGVNEKRRVYALVLVVGAYSEFAVVIEGVYSTRYLAEERMAELGFSRENDYTGRMMMENDEDNAALVNRIEHKEWPAFFEAYESVNLTFQDVESEIVELGVEDGFSESR